MFAHLETILYSYRNCAIFRFLRDMTKRAQLQLFIILKINS